MKVVLESASLEERVFGEKFASLWKVSLLLPGVISSSYTPSLSCPYAKEEPYQNYFPSLSSASVITTIKNNQTRLEHLY